METVRITVYLGTDFHILKNNKENLDYVMSTVVYDLLEDEKYYINAMCNRNDCMGLAISVIGTNRPVFHMVAYEDSNLTYISKQTVEVLNLLVIPANDLKLYYTIVD
jgi:hypothetical protein